jgi:perosamine synthetase
VTCSGNFSCITEQGHNPILIDSEKNSYNTSLKKIKERITKKTSLIQLTHAGGEPTRDIKEISKFAKKRNIFLLEDCSQSIGAEINNKKVGNFGDVAAFSTMYRKNLAANSSSGIVFTKNFKLYRKILAYADRGKILWNKKLDLRDPKHSLFPALNWNTDEFSCAMGYANLKRLSKTNNMRKKFLEILIKLLQKQNIRSCKPLNYNRGYAPFYFPIQYDAKVLRISKKKFTDALIKEGIPLGWQYGCLVSNWNWAKKYLSDKFKSKNALLTRDKCFHLYLNENYGLREALDIVNSIKKIENYYS